ncbi:MAG: hypothetical protein PVS2B2_25370 [Candidatus Acidiferrum sp.]
MNLRKIIFGELLLALTFTFGTSSARAQEQTQEPPDAQPKPAAHSTPVPFIDPALDDESNSNKRNDQLQPDLTPLTGVQEATLGSPQLLHSYWEPGLQYASTIQTAGGGNWSVNNYLIGNISLLKAWSRSQFSVNYSGGGSFSTDSSQGIGSYQQLALSQTFVRNRWTVQLVDQFSYLPQSQFGFGGGTSLGIPGVPGPGGVNIPPLSSNFASNQSIFAALGPRYSNAASLQVTYAISPRGSITASGTYGFLRFIDAGNVDNSSPIGSLGYNYALSRESTIGLDYRFTGFHYAGQQQAIGSHVIGVAYGRKLTGRLALRLNGGPQITTLRVPVGGETEKIGANTEVSFTYAMQNGSFTGGYLHGLTGGSGVFTGSTTDQVNFGALRKLSRAWTLNFNSGYAHNKSLGNFGTASLPTYTSWFVGGGASRPFGRNVNFAVAYNANINRSSQTACVLGTACFPSQTVHYVTLNLQWHTRPFVLE